MKLDYKGVPKPQVLYSENIDMSHYTILGIEKVTCDPPLLSGLLEVRILP